MCLCNITLRMDMWEMIRQRKILLNAINSLGCVSLALERVLVSAQGQVHEQGSASLSWWIKETVSWEGMDISVPSTACSAEHKALAAFWTEALPPAELNIIKREPPAFFFFLQSLKRRAVTQTPSCNSRNQELFRLLDTLVHSVSHNFSFLVLVGSWDGKPQSRF